MTSPEDEIFKNFQKMTVSDEDINILLLGETGVGKSTFINAFANYLEYDKFNIAEKSKVRCLIPAKFTVTDDNLKEQRVEIGRNDNENETIAESNTLEARSYVFPVNKNEIKRIRLIDTPGIGDTRGIDQDNENMENILQYISHLENLHAICFLLKPNNVRLTVMFEYCIKQLLSRLEKSASKNIIFLFTNSRSTFYKPGDTTSALKAVLEAIKSKPPHAEIKFIRDNVFCLDNESFRYLVAVKNGIKLGNKESFAQSWSHSVQECWRMIRFIGGGGNSELKITPHKVKDTMSVNQTRTVILQLSQPLADIADLINDNIRSLERQNKSLRTDNTSIATLKQNLYVPVINLRCKELSQPTTVCTAQKCSEIYTVSGRKKYHYKQRCHDPCYLQTVPKEMIGSPELINCYAMSNKKCRECNCDFSTHMHIYYVSETFEDKISNAGVQAQIKDRETALKETEKVIAQIEARKLTYEHEKDTIIKSMAKFAHFLQRNAIAPYNDAYKAYIEYLIDREKSQGSEYDPQMVKYYNELLKRYSEEKKILDDAFSLPAGNRSEITAADVFNTVESLYRLQHTGKKIKQLHSTQSKSQKMEHKSTEIVLDEANNEFLHQKEQNKRNRVRNKKQNYQEQNSLNTAQFKAKGRRQQQQSFNKNQNNYGHQNIPDLRRINTQKPVHFPQQYNDFSTRRPNYNPHFNQGFQNYPGLHGNFQNQLGPHGNFHNQPGSPHGNFQNQPGNFQNQPGSPHGNFQNQPGPHGNLQNQPGPHGNFQGQPVSYGNFQNQPGIAGDFSNYQNYHPGPSGGFPSHPGYQDIFSNNLKPQHPDSFTAQNYPNSQMNDPKFNEWFRKVTENSDVVGTSKNVASAGFQSINNLAKKVESSDEASDQSSENNESADDDEEFKEFMKKNNLDYLVKPSTKNTNKDINIKQSKKNKGSYQTNSHDRIGKRKDDSDSDDQKNNGNAKGKNLFSNIFNKMF